MSSIQVRYNWLPELAGKTLAVFPMQGLTPIGSIVASRHNPLNNDDNVAMAELSDWLTIVPLEKIRVAVPNATLVVNGYPIAEVSVVMAR